MFNKMLFHFDWGYMNIELLWLSDTFKLWTTLRFKTGITDVGKKAALLKWDWVGHSGAVTAGQNSPYNRCQTFAQQWDPVSSIKRHLKF